MLAGFGEHFNLDRDAALKLGRAFGAGMGQGLTCGAVTGAFMIMGLVLDEVIGNDRRARYSCYAMVREFVRRFESRHGSIVCQELLGVDLGTDEGMKEAQERNLFRTVCPVYVKDAARILKELM